MNTIDIARHALQSFIDIYRSELNVEDSKLDSTVNNFLSTYKYQDSQSNNRSLAFNNRFNESVCYCRIYKNGYSKQCSTSKQDNSNYCKLHNSKIQETEEKVWKFGNYNEPLPTKHLSGKEKGKLISWKTKTDEDNTYRSDLPKPRGRTPVGKEWDSIQGKWIHKPSIPIELALSELKVSELKKKALKLGVSQVTINKVDDDINIRESLTKLIELQLNKQHLKKESTYSNSTLSELKKIAKVKGIITKDNLDCKDTLVSTIDEYSIELEVDDTSPKVETNIECTYVFQGVEYMWDKETNELLNPEYYSKIGTLSSDKKTIDFINDSAEEYHINHENNTTNVNIEIPLLTN